MGIRSNGQGIAFTYDDLGRLVSARGSGVHEDFAYDDKHRLIYQSSLLPHSSKRDIRRFVYDDEADRLTGELVAGQWSNYSYDARGNLIQSSSKDSRKAYSAVYSGGRIVGMNGGKTSLKLEYDSLGAVTAQVNASGKHEIIRDRHGWVVGSRAPSGLQVEYTRNTRGELLQRNDNRGENVTFNRDSSGLLTKVESSIGLWVTATRDSLGRIIKLTNSIGQSRAFSYDVAGRLTNFKDAANNEFTVQYDQSGAPLRMVQKGGKQVITRAATGGQTAARSPQLYHDAWQDPVEAHSLLGSFNDGAARKIANPGASPGQFADEPVGPPDPDCGGGGGGCTPAQTAACAKCYNFADLILAGCLAGASTAAAYGEFVCSQAANPTDECYAAVAAAYAVAVYLCIVNHSSQQFSCSNQAYCTC